MRMSQSEVSLTDRTNRNKSNEYKRELLEFVDNDRAVNAREIYLLSMPLLHNDTDCGIGASTIQKHNPAVDKHQDDSSPFHVFFNICKCFAGAASFELPWAISQGGCVFSVISLIVLAYLTSFTLVWLAECGHFHPTLSKPTYPQIAEYAFGKIGFIIAWFGILAMTIGVCGSYLVFIGNQMSIMVSPTYYFFTQVNCTIITATLAMILSWLRSYRLLVPTSQAGLLALLFALICVVINAANHMSNITERIYAQQVTFVDFENYPLFMGNAAFLYLIHSVILPIEQGMKGRTHGRLTKGYKEALNQAIVVVTILNVLFAVFVYLAFEDKICGNALDNLNEGWLKSLVRVLICLDLVFTYALFLFPMTQSLERVVFNENQFGLSWQIEAKRNMLRTLIVFATCCIALLVPSFEQLTGLTGAFGNNMLGMILPPLMYFKLAKSNHVEISLYHTCVGYFVSCFGVLMLFVCCYFFVIAIINTPASQTCT